MTQWQCFGSRYLESCYKFYRVLIMLLVVEGGKHNESVLSAKPAKQHRLVKAPG